uniref:Uncharacterized protein n=1 Tax=Anopheles atroparvus TaxID=41427 RepID=A0A182JGR1_ANOAO
MTCVASSSSTVISPWWLVTMSVILFAVARSTSGRMYTIGRRMHSASISAVSMSSTICPIGSLRIGFLLTVKSNFRQRCSALYRYMVERMWHRAPPGLKSMKHRIWKKTTSLRYSEDQRGITNLKAVGGVRRRKHAVLVKQLHDQVAPLLEYLAMTLLLGRVDRSLRRRLGRPRRPFVSSSGGSCTASASTTTTTSANTSSHFRRHFYKRKMTFTSILLAKKLGYAAAVGGSLFAEKGCTFLPAARDLPLYCSMLKSGPKNRFPITYELDGVAVLERGGALPSECRLLC